jgi:KUP system potassium uptake protein
LLWFTMLAILGLSQVIQHPEVFNAINPKYAIALLTEYPQGFWLLGAVFLCTTGAEALYSDLGHCGRENIRISWIFVKVALILNYMGQASWIMKQSSIADVNPFYAIMPDWFLLPGIIIATMAAIIASQALISGSFTLVSEAMNLNFWPRVGVKFPTELKGQLYIPSVNWLLWAGCMGVMLYFRESKHMEAAYGFFITIAMLMTTLLLSYYLIFKRRWPIWLVAVTVGVFFAVEISFFVANILKLKEAWMMLIVYVVILHVMWITHTYRKLSNSFIQFADLDDYVATLNQLSGDTRIPKYATHLVFLTKANHRHQIENKIIDSILSKTPKRADVYWFVHVDRTNEPYTKEYEVDEVENDLIIKVNIRLGFRVPAKVNNFFKCILDDMVKRNTFDVSKKPEPYQDYNSNLDVKFVVLEKYLSADNDLSVKENFVTSGYEWMKEQALSDIDAWGLEEADTVLEKVPLVVKPSKKIELVCKN